ncbi:MAG: phosphoadenosine phosphosulfate reductase family protein [Clostridiales bacterium]|nr:phosphoadenosine phosphosulfate reductase family protein [Clostridiales bacterium]
MYGYEWTEEYGIFRLTVDAKIQKEIRPVFWEELDFFEMYKYWDYPKNTKEPLLWAEGIRKYVLNGVCVAEAQGGSFYSKPVIELKTDERLKLKAVDVNRLYEVNRRLLVNLEQMEIAFIQEQYKAYSKKGYLFVCAFSGGKDSSLLLDLVSKALSPDKYYVIFSNTGMELKSTLNAVEAAKQRWSELRFEESECHMKPAESWKEFGPPGQRMRWCCTVHKSVPAILKLRDLSGNYNAKAIVYDGVRAEESVRRSKYDKISVGAKNINQINCHAIIEWNTAELYCYLLANDLLLNDAYRVGLFRVGCMVCPMQSGWSESIVGFHYESEAKQLRTMVEKYVANTKPESERKKYIEKGSWKARVGGKGLDNGGNRVKEVIEKNTLNITITKPKQKWTDVACILGVFVEQDEKYLLQKIGTQNYECRIKQDKDTITISYYPFYQMDRFVISRIRGAANKVAYCVGCKACMVQCPTGAFTIQPGGKILIRENLCIHCNNCIEFAERGCIVSDNMRIPEGGFTNMKGLDPYHGFGFRQAWLTHFTEEGINCFSMGVLGTVQYSALKTWLKQAEMIEMKRVGRANAVSITELGEKLASIGSYNPFTWAVIWANLCYNSTICRWYCLNSERGGVYEKADLVMMLGDSYSKSNRDNAITALTETFRYSPIGAALKQGLPVEVKKNSFTYLRDGWDYPDAAALLYALYLYAEHTGRKTFTFTELANAHANPEAQGISPHDIYGIDVKAFRENIQGLAMTYPQYIRVSFVANLDNIILENYTSNDILDLAESD